MSIKKVTEEELLDILNEMLAKQEESEHCKFTAVTWHEADEMGINWSANLNSSGKPILFCKEAFEAVLAEARTLYLLDK